MGSSFDLEEIEQGWIDELDWAVANLFPIVLVEEQ